MLLNEAMRMFEQENWTRALALLRQCRSINTTKQIDDHIRLCECKLARKLWRQGRGDDLQKLMQEAGMKRLALAAARLQGPQHLADLAAANEGMFSRLAACSLEKEIKAALLSMRQCEDLKPVAEGWIALLKGDTGRSKAAFQIAEKNAPVQARVGQAIICLTQNDRVGADILLQALRPYSKQFPQLSKILFWDDPIREERKKLSHYLFHASFKELEQVEETIPSSMKTLKAWIYLRMGDLICSQQEEQALALWHRALDLLSTLRIDVLKRCYLSSLSPSSCLDRNESFFNFYRELRKKSSDDAKNFIEHLVFERSYSETGVDFNHLRSSKGKWLYDPPPVEIRLFWLHNVYEAHLRHSADVICFPSDLSPDCHFLTVNEWEDFFRTLDPVYGQKEQYLRYQLTVAQLIGHSTLLRKTAFDWLRLNPHLQNPLLVIYCKEALRAASRFECKDNLLSGLDEWENLRKKIRREAESLYELFPGNFDLVRLLLLIRNHFEERDKTISQFSTQMPEALFAVLKLQWAIDRGEGEAECKKFIVPLAVVEKSAEASFRLLMALSCPVLRFPKKSWTQFCDHLYPNAEMKHDNFLRFYSYGQIIPYTFLISWLKRNPQDWRPHYHLALHYALSKDSNRMIDELCKASAHMPTDAPQAAAVNKTIYLYQMHDLKSDGMLETLLMEMFPNGR
jgi:hypothetical protein